MVLDGNELTGLPSALKNLTKLKVLKADNNNIGGVGDVTSTMPDLRIVRLSGNNLTSAPDLSSNLIMHDLDLSKNYIASIPAEYNNLTALRFFDVRPLTPSLLMPFLLRF